MNNHHSAVVEALIEAAEDHGMNSEPDHEVGDLQEYLRSAFALLTPDQVRQLVHLPAVRSTFEAATGSELEAGALLQTLDQISSTAPGPAPAPTPQSDGLQLFDALFAANFVLVNEYQIERVSHCLGDQTVAFAECDDDHVWLFRDQPIQLDSFGRTQAVDKFGNTVTVEFRMSRPMSIEDTRNI